MAYKPYKVNKGNNYADYQKAHNPQNEMPRMKLFGFRTGAAWKMIPALFYYIFMAIMVVSSVSGEIREFKFEGIDVILVTLKYLFITVLLFSPAIFLSDFKFKEKLPLFKKKTVSGNVWGMIIVIVFSLFLIWTYQYCMSDTYKDSANAYYEEMESKNLEQMKEYEESTSK